MGSLALATQGLRPKPKAPSREEDICAMTIGGMVVLADLDFGILIGDVPCVVIRWDGSVGIEYPRNTTKPDSMGERTGFYYIAPTKSYILEQSAACTILGRVIEQH